MRDLKVKYAQTSLGVTWSIIQPLTALLIFTFFFGHLLDRKAGNLPYALHVLSGLLGWNFFSYIVHVGVQNPMQPDQQLVNNKPFSSGHGCDRRPIDQKVRLEYLRDRIHSVLVELKFRSSEQEAQRKGPNEHEW